MGRVYNALMRADRWRDNAEPIGSPAMAEAGRPCPEPLDRGQERASTAPDAQAPGSPFLFDTTADVDGFISASFQQAVIDDPSPNRFARNQPAHEHFSGERAANQSDILTDILAASAPPPQLSVAPAPAPAFVEPRQSANVHDLPLDPHLPAIASGDDLASERYRTLAVRLINFASKRKLKTLLVTSAQEGEGKSTVAANLAWVMAKAGARRVLLLDADLRRPSSARMLGVEPRGGWLDMTEGRAKFEDAAVRLDPNSLYLLAPQAARNHAANGMKGAGAPLIDHAAASEAVTSSRVEELLEDLERHFDFILIDAPPILEFADAQRLASIVDGSVMVVRAARTHHEMVSDALKLIPKERRLGVVLNEAQTDEEVAYGYRKKKAGIKAALKDKRERSR
ncbi:MAG TPA: CpsD/CapB family tyrosine-protein kinase [Blastocatellia bacterium]|nr:CpsD/CapB family tyrosine-protein kinase [Blastocatellia bacterium]